MTATRRQWLACLVFFGWPAPGILGQTPAPAPAPQPAAHDSAGSPQPPRAPVFVSDIVDEQPVFVSAAAPPQYPDTLRQAGIQGRVIVRLILDTLGRPEPQSLRVVATANDGFNQAAIRYVLGCLFRPARVHGQAVRVLIEVPLDFKIAPS